MSFELPFLISLLIDFTYNINANYIKCILFSCITHNCFPVIIGNFTIELIVLVLHFPSCFKISTFL